MVKNQRINEEAFFQRDVLIVAPWLIGKYLVRKFDNGQTIRLKITETEAYKGIDDLACHASKGKTSRNQIMFEQGGFVYMYLIYGMYWMLNIVTGGTQNPQAVLIRGLEGFDGPGKLTRHLQLDKSFYSESICFSERLWIEADEQVHTYKTSARIGIDYAGEPWRSIEWRFTMK